MINKFDETQLEQAFIELLTESNYIHSKSSEISRDISNVLIEDDLKEYLINKYDLSNYQIENIQNKLKNISSSDLYKANKEIHKLITSGFYIKNDNDDERTFVQLVDNENFENNIFRLVSQFEIKGNKKRIPDIVLFLNGLPLIVIEFKSAIRSSTTIYDAYKQLSVRYQRDIPELFKYNMFSIISDGVNTKIGTIFSDYKYFYSWNTKNTKKNKKGFSSLTNVIEGPLSRKNIVSIISNFIYFPDRSSEHEKYLSRYPQFYGAKDIYQSVLKNKRPHGDGKGGTYFGATGSGKTLTMLYLAKLLNNDNELKNPSIVVISDRTDLDDQISNLFLNSKNFIGDNNIVNVDSRKDLSEKLSNIKSGGVFMTTIQKFNKDIGVLSDRDNIICISDEAHRTQVQTTNKLVISNDEMKEGYSFAKAVRNSFPLATYVGFTGTPIDETLNTFGEIVNSYTMEQSVKDGITTPIFYEGRNLKVVTNKNKLEEIEEYYRKCLEEGSNEYQINESKKAMARLNSILGNPERLELLSEDFINHYENRIDEGSYQLGKVMIVCSKREIAFDLYKLLISKRPSWVNKISDESNISDKNDSGIEKIKLVITRSKDDEKELYELAGNKKYRKSLDRSFKDKDSNFKIAIVVDMWTTGFDVPSLEAIYIDKPLKEHTLIQTISRVNRVHSGKESGLVIDYIGIKNSMNLALKEFNNNEKNNFQDVNDVQILLKEHLLLIDNLVDNKKFEDYSKMSPKDRFIYLNNLTEYIQSTEALEVKFMSLATKLHSLFRVCSSSEKITSEEHDRIQNYLAARTMIFKLTKGDAPDISIMNKEVEELVNESLISKSIDEVFKMSKDSEVINLFDSKNMELIQKIELPNTKLKALQKLINGGIKEVTKISKVKSIEFSKKFQKLVDKYNERNELETLRKNFLEDLAEEFTILAEDVSKEIEEFRTLGVSYEEKTYYDILHNSIQKNEFEYEESKLVDIAKTIKIIIDDISTNSDWSNREDLKAKINVQLTIILDEHNFPPVPEGEIYNEVVLQAMNYSSIDQ